VIDEVSMRLSCRGGEAGGVAGSPPGEHTGMCLLGTAAGVPRDEVLSDRCGGGVDVRCGMGIDALATAAVMLAVGANDDQVQLKARHESTSTACQPSKVLHDSNRLDNLGSLFQIKRVPMAEVEH